VNHQTCLHAYNGGRSGWTLNGLAIRSVQSIGLHRDGNNFKLSPFESEMQRRLWWYMFAIDRRAAEDHGIALSNSNGSSDTRSQLNLDNSELTPNMQELPVEKAKWTEMTFALTMIETGQGPQRLYQTLAASFNTAPSESSRDKILNGLLTRLDEYVRHCDPNIPIQKVTLLCARLMVAQLDFFNNTTMGESLRCRETRVSRNRG
jgi:hypothetical protein